MKAFCILSFIFLAGQGYAQHKEYRWYVGEVKLADGIILTGQLAYDIAYDVVKHQGQQGLRTYSTLHVEEFSFVDTTYYLPRKFYSLPFNVQPDYKRLMLFESLTEGKLSLFAREKKIRIEPTMDDMIGMVPMVGAEREPLSSQWETRYDFYVGDSLGRLYDLTENTQEGLLQLMQDQMVAMRQYVKAKNPDFSKRDDVVTIVRYYNALSNASQSLDPDIEIIRSGSKIPIW